MSNIYSIIYYIRNSSEVLNHIRNLSIQKLGNNYEAKVYLVRLNENIKKLLLSEPNFIKLGLDDKGVYAMFKIPKKYEYLVIIIDKTGYKGMTKEMLSLYNNKALGKKILPKAFFVPNDKKYTHRVNLHFHLRNPISNHKANFFVQIYQVSLLAFHDIFFLQMDQQTVRKNYETESFS